MFPMNNMGFMGKKEEGLPFIFSVTVGSGETITIPSRGTYDCDVDWGDGSPPTYINQWNQPFPGRTHTYAVAGTYDISITGYLDGWAINYQGDRLRFTEIKQWGMLTVLSLNTFMYGAQNLTITATDMLDISAVTTCNFAFRLCTSIVSIPNLNDWDFSNVVDFSEMFYKATSFNQEILFNSTSGTDFSYMLCVAYSFNSTFAPNVSSATSFSGLFRSASSFNQPLNLTTSPSLVDMKEMMYGTNSFNNDFNISDVSNVVSMQTMFYLNPVFNQPLNLNSTSNTNMYFFLRSCSAFKQSLGDVNISNVTNWTDFLAGVLLPTAAYDDTLIKWSAQNPQSGQNVSFGSAKYTAGGSAEAARAVLTGTYGWTITDGGPV